MKLKKGMTKMEALASAYDERAAGTLVVIIRLSGPLRNNTNTVHQANTARTENT